VSLRAGRYEQRYDPFFSPPQGRSIGGRGHARRRGGGRGTEVLSIELLGPPRVSVDGAPLTVDTRKATAVLAMVALDGPIARDLLAGRLWSESDDTRARGALRRTLSVLGTGLGGRWLSVDRRTVELHTEGCWIDVRSFTSRLRAVENHEHASLLACDGCLQGLRDAVVLHRGELMAGFTLRDSVEFDDWRRSHDERLRRELCGALDQLTRAEAERGELGDALQHAERWLEVDPLGEHVHARLMLLHAWRGERSAAVQRYRECAAVLDRELGVRPLARTTALYHAVVEGRVERPRATSLTEVPVPPSRPPGPTHSGPPGELPFVGRTPLLATGRSHLAGAGGRLLTIEGEAGIGKTRYVEELEAALHREGTPVLAARCHAGERGLALGPVIELLRAASRRSGAADRLPQLPAHVRAEAGRLLPDLTGDEEVPPPGSSDDPGARVRFLDAAATALVTLATDGTRYPVVVLEDVQHADDGTVDLLVFLVHRLAVHPLGLVLTWRGEELPASHPLRRALGDPDVTRLRQEIPLGRLGADDLAQLSAALPTPLPEDRLARLLRESEGLPLAVVEYLRLAGDTHPAAGEDWPIPAGVRELIAGRLAELSETGAQVATAASVLGHDIDPGLLAHTAGRSEVETVAAVEELLDRGILRVTETGSYDFTHEKVAAVAYERASPVRRRLLHGRAAETLARRAERRGGGTLAAIVAEHARLGGLEVLAASWYVVAADHATTVFAHAEARAHLERALELGHDDPSSVHRRLARLLVLDGDYVAALERYEAAAGLAERGSALARVEHELGGLHLRRGRWAAAAAHLEAALGALGDHEPGAAARVTADLGLLELRTGVLAAAEVHATAALQLAEEADDLEAIAQARNLAGLLARRTGRHADAQRHLEHGAALARGLPDPSAYIAALNNLALTTADAGELDRARTLLEAAIGRCAELGDRHRRAALHNNLADLLHRSGDEEGSMQHLRQAVTLFAEVGSADDHDPEIWKLVDW
jgi:DNA-binding SARP family transcriptional activator/tetratricopeptide (TPR) repeat protein